MMVSSRSSALRQIMQIENRIKHVRKSQRYKRIRKNIQVLEMDRGHHIIEVDIPGDMEKSVSVRRNSERSRSMLEKYQTQMNEYDVLISELNKKKKTLTAELF